jgi:hypothetical protein
MEQVLPHLDLQALQDTSNPHHSAHLEKVRTALNMLTAILLGSFDHFRGDMKKTLSELYSIVLPKFGSEEALSAVMGVFYVRYLCPALAMPRLSLNVSTSPHGQKYCILLSRILQAGAFHTEFQNENMKFANSFLGQMHKTLSILTRKLCGLSLSPEQKEIAKQCRATYDKCGAQYRLPCTRDKRTHTCYEGDEDYRVWHPSPIEDTIAYFDDFLREEFKIRMMIKGWPDTCLYNRKSALTSVKQFRVELALEMNS